MAKDLSNESLGQPIKYDPNFDGPLKRRSCTDVICLLLFLVFISCWIAIGVYSIVKGNPQTLLVPKDSQGRRCGLDTSVKNKPYLFFFDLTKCFSPTTFFGCNTPQVCVERCPSITFLYLSVHSELANTNQVKQFCQENHQTDDYSPSYCPTWLLPSNSFFNRCLYNVADRKQLKWEISSIEGDEITLAKQYFNPVHMWLSLVIHNGIAIFKDEQNIHEVAEQVVADIITSWWKILIGAGLALLACIIYILMLRWIAAPMIWGSLLAVLAGLAASIYFSTKAYQKWSNQYQIDHESSSKTKRDIFLALLIIVSLVLGIITLMLLFLRNRIRLAIALIKEGSRAVSSVTSILFFPIFPWIFQVGVVAYAVCVGVYLATVGEPLYQIRNISLDCSAERGWTNNTPCNPKNFSDEKGTQSCVNSMCNFIKIDNSSFYPYMQALNIFGFFWIAFFVSAFGQMVLAQVFAQWYWTPKKGTLPFFAITAAIYRTLRYHLGTLAFGSLIIAICRMIRVCLEYLDQKLKKYDNGFTKAILCCLKCFFWCLEKFIKFINKNAYIMCAIHGKNFCSSAKDAFMLLMRNIIRVFVLDKVTDFLFFLSKVLVTIGVGAVAYVFFATDLISFMDNSQLNYGVVPVILIMIATYLISSLFFSVYSMAVDTLFLCFLEDCERNDGVNRPYFMSKNLMRIFGRKNKIH